MAQMKADAKERCPGASLEQRLRELEEQIRVLDMFIENATDAIQISDRNLVTVRINRAYEKLTGIQREELVGVPVEELVRSCLISESCGAIVARTKKPCTIVQTFSRTGRSAHVSCNPVFDEAGNIEFFICNDRDLDEISSLQSELQEIKVLNDRYLSELENLKAQMPNWGELIVEDKAMLKALDLASRVAKVDSTTLLLGETGVGKDEVARFIHRNSSRAEHPLISVNCGAITESLFESEFFGHESYAFTGAGSKSRAGLFEVADHGTMFLDEIGSMCFRASPLSGWAAQSPFKWTFASSPPQTATWRRWFVRSAFGRICFTGSTWSLSTSRLCGNGGTISSLWPSIFWIIITAKTAVISACHLTPAWL